MKRDARLGGSALGRGYWALLRNELVGSRLVMVLFPVVVAAWQAFLLTRRGRMPEEAIFGLAWLPLAVLPFWAVFDGFQGLRAEWSTNCIYTLRSLPLPGLILLTAKLGGLLVELLWYTLVTAMGAVAVAASVGVGGAPLRQLPPTVWASLGLKACAVYLALCLGLAVVSQTSYLVGRLVDRFQAAASGAALALSFWVLGRGTVIIAPALGWLPPLRFETINQINGVASRGYALVSSAPLAAGVLILVGFTVAGSWLLDRAVDV